MSKDQTQLKAFLQAESVLTIATGDLCGPWSAPVLYVADISIDPVTLYFLSSANSRHIKSLSVGGVSAVSIYSDYDGNWQSIRGAQMHGVIEQVADLNKEQVADRYFDRFAEIKALIDNPQTEQERLIGSAFGRSCFYQFRPTFIRFTNNADSFAGRTEWQL